jgi:hypothetical protein
VRNGGGLRQDVREPTEPAGQQSVGHERMFPRRHGHNEQAEPAHQLAAGNEQVPHHSAGPGIADDTQESHLLRQGVRQNLDYHINHILVL